MKCGHLAQNDTYYKIPRGYGFDLHCCKDVKTIVLYPGTATALQWKSETDTFLLVLKGVAAIISVDTKNGTEDCQHLDVNEYATIKHNDMWQIKSAEDNDKVVVLKVDLEGSYEDRNTFYYKIGDKKKK